MDGHEVERITCGCFAFLCTGVWQSYRKMLEKSECIMEDDGK